MQWLDTWFYLDFHQLYRDFTVSTEISTEIKTNFFKVLRSLGRR